MSTLPRVNNLLDIYEDGLFIGNGELSAAGELLDFPVPLNDAVLDVLEDAISSGKQQIKIGTHAYSWTASDLATIR